MIIIKINENEFNFPEDFSEISVFDFPKLYNNEYTKWLNKKNQSESDYENNVINFIKAVLKVYIPKEFVNELSDEDITEIGNEINYIFQEPINKPKKTITIGNNTYKFKDLQELTYKEGAELITLTFDNEDIYKNISTILSMLTDYQSIEEVYFKRTQFESLCINDVYGILKEFFEWKNEQMLNLNEVQYKPKSNGKSNPPFSDVYLFDILTKKVWENYGINMNQLNELNFEEMMFKINSILNHEAYIASLV